MNLYTVSRGALTKRVETQNTECAAVAFCFARLRPDRHGDTDLGKVTVTDASGASEVFHISVEWICEFVATPENEVMG